MAKQLKIDSNRVIEASERQRTSLDNPGFCLTCGEEVDGCEPDAEGYECEFCGAKTVFGAEQVLMMGAIQDNPECE